MPPWLLGHQWSGDSPGARLRQARVAKNMTIRDLSTATGLSVTAIGNLEADKFNAALPNLRLLAKALGVPIAYLGCFEKLPENTLGQRITKARLYHGLTKEEMALAIGVDPKTLRNWEQGKHVPLPRYFNVLNQYLKVLEE
nr:helix-turn-helix transcriptional regulator [Desulfotomaculum copahuensis]